MKEQWRGEEPQEGDSGLRTRTPLRQFVPGNLFDDLLVPDVELQVPGQRGQWQVEHLPALRTLREFCPGNVTRHFGVWAANKRHWIPLPEETSGEQEVLVDVTSTYQAVLVDAIGVGDERVAVYAPVAARLDSVPPPVKDASAVRPDWQFHVTALGRGCPVRLGRGVDQLFEGLTAHLHIQGGGVRTLRYAKTAQGTVWDPQSRPVRLRFGLSNSASWTPAALGVDIHCDALEGVVHIPERPVSPTPQERTYRLRHLLQVEVELPSEMSTFEREMLGEIALLATITARLDRETPLQEHEVSGALEAAATTIGLIDGDHAHVDHEQTWALWCHDPQVVAAVWRAVEEVSSDERSPSWMAWWRKRYTLSVAHITLAGLSMMCPGVDVDELMIDLDPRDDRRFWLTEPSPGGTGQVEAFLSALTQDTEAFTRALDDALNPSVRCGKPDLVRAAAGDRLD